LGQERQNGSSGRSAGGSPFWTAKEAAAYLKISTSTLYRYCRRKTEQNNEPQTKLTTNPPPFRRAGRNVLRFPIDEFRAWCHQYDLW